MIRKSTVAAVLFASMSLAGCFEPEEGGFKDARDVVASVIASVENAPRVAGAQGGWPETSFGTGVVRAVKAKLDNLVVRYVLEVDVTTEEACMGAMTAAYPGAQTISLGGTFHDPSKLEPYYVGSGKHRHQVSPSRELCDAQGFPTRIVALRAGGGVPLGGFRNQASGEAR
jgi:hypothetical protein